MYTCPECGIDYLSPQDALDCRDRDVDRLMRQPPKRRGERCLACSSPYNIQHAHWPIAKGSGGRSKLEDAKLPKIWLCLECHIGKEHTEADRKTTETLISRAPEYWKSVGKWEDWRETFETWVELYRHKGETCR